MQGRRLWLQTEQWYFRLRSWHHASTTHTAPPLHRWCHPTSRGHVCDWTVKVDAANTDNSNAVAPTHSEVKKAYEDIDHMVWLLGSFYPR